MKVLTLQRIEIFKMIYETGSITEAAKRLGLAQPTVSRHLSYFESALKLKLFSNDRGRIKPTWEAHRLFRECDGMFERLRQIELAVHDLQTGENERFRMMVVPSMANMPILADALKNVLKKRPKVKLTVDVGSSHAQIEALREGHIELGVAGSATLHPDIEVDTIQKLQIVALVHRNHPLASKAFVEWHDFQDHYCVMMSNTGPIGNLIEKEFRSQGITPATNVEVMSPPLIPSFVRSLECCALVDSMTAKFMAEQMDLLTKPIKPSLTSNIHIIRRQSGPDRQMGRLIHQALKAEIERLATGY
ncbi:MAG: LysR family transcriptional regulator [Sneathiella sp.]|nr:LysR family transcriptional regulator [Sneathiella sp.]